MQTVQTSYEDRGCVVQSAAFLTADTCLTADPGMGSSLLARSHTFVEIDHDIISTAIILPLNQEWLLPDSYK